MRGRRKNPAMAFFTRDMVPLRLIWGEKDTCNK
jgi:hypothetical protein